MIRFTKDGKVDRMFSQVNPGWALPSRTQVQLADALDAASKDAARYRYLRNGVYLQTDCGGTADQIIWYKEEELDRIIDKEIDTGERG